MRRFTLLLSVFCFLAAATAQTDVTGKYIDNPNFEARFAGWVNNGMLFQTNTSFGPKDGMVYMEKYVSAGKVPTVSIRQTLVGLEPGTYTLTAGAQNIQQNSSAAQTGAYLFAGSEQTEVSAADDYSVTFTVIDGTAEIGFRTAGATGNWVCADNFRLYYNGIVREAIDAELQKLVTEAESVIGDGNTAAALQTAIDNAKAVLNDNGQPAGTDYQTAALALKRATLDYRISNATGNVPTVTTNPFVAMGTTIALGRSTVKGTAAERGLCWSTEPNPTVLDNRTTRYFSNNGNIYVMEHLEPGTVYYVRAYAMTADYQVGYGDVVKIATLPKGQVTTWYDNAGSEQENFRIASAVNEVEWLYNNLANIRGFNLSVHYVQGAGAGGGTADCSYGGWMRVSQNTPYQQTGTILHETNHGVGVGTTWYWYNCSDLRENTSSGKWLGPRANQMVQFLQNDAAAFLQGDGTHMWAGSPNSGISMLAYGINGAHEDSYNPENTLLYYSNILITHALHQDGMVCSNSVGFATPAYVFQQDDQQKYYLRCEDESNTGFLTLSTTGALRTQPFEAEKADNFAWYITYDPQTGYYMFQNVGTGKYITYATSGTSGSIKTATKTQVTANEKFHLLPARKNVTMGDFTGTAFWIVKKASSAVTLQAGTTATTTTTAYDMSNMATAQRWLFLTEDQMTAYNSAATTKMLSQLETLIASVQSLIDTPHKSKKEEDITATDTELLDVLNGINSEKDSYSTPADVNTAIDNIKSAVIKFLGKIKVSSVTHPMDVSFLLVNPTLATDCNGWSTTTKNEYSCCEFFQKTFDFNQTISLKMPAATYELRVQAFQRVGSADDSYTDYTENGTKNVTTYAYIKTKTAQVKNIWEDAQSKSLGGSTKNKNGKYIPNNMQAAGKWFEAGHYDNSVMLTTTTAGTMKLGIRSGSQATDYWSIFSNFRLYFYGDYTIDEVVTPVEAVRDLTAQDNGSIYDLTGRRIDKPTRGIYIRNGRKVVVK